MFDISDLNPQQRDAVRAIEGPVQILAGAGTGKTRAITSRVIHMIQSGIAPNKILCVTFTNKAAKEMLERITPMIPKSKRKDRPTVCTFHSLCVRILREHIHHLGYRNQFVIYSAGDQLAVVKRLLSRLHTNEPTDANAILSALSKLRNHPEKHKYEKSSEFAYARKLQPKYEQTLRLSNALDFDDLILLTLRLFKESEEALQKTQDRYHYVMIDEYQDTNDAQFRLVSALTTQRRNLCVVGDDDQSIYSWRGAEISNLLDMEKHYPELKIVKLEQNYRSTNTILEAANAVIANNARRRSKTLWSDKGKGDPIRILAFEEDRLEAEAVADEIEAARLGRNVTWGDQAILIRTNQQARPIETALREAKIRYKVIGGPSFFDRREIRDFVAYANVLCNPDDDTSLLRIINTPTRGISGATVKILSDAAHERDCPIFKTLFHTDVLDVLLTRARRAVDSFRDLMTHAQEEASALQPNELAKWLKKFFKDIEYFEDLRSSEKNPEIGEARVRNVVELIDSIEEDTEDLFGGGDPLATLRQKLETITLDQEREDSKKEQTDSERVTVITTHSCKGLEFPLVYLVGVEDGIFPHIRSKLEGNEDEERRLFYVAMTRAMNTLTLTYCLNRRRHGSLDPATPSPFIQEIPSHLVDHVQPNERRPVDTTQSANFFAAMRQAIE